MKISAPQILALGAVGIGGFIVFRTVTAARNVAQAINPLNNNNVVAEGVNELVQVVTRDPGTSLGSSIFDFVQRIRGIPPFDPNAPVKVAPPIVSNQQPVKGGD